MGDASGIPARHGASLAVPLSSVKEVQVRRGDAAKTVFAVLGATVAIALVAVATSDNGSSTPVQQQSDSIVFSCPLVYSWDGTHWRLDSGTFGGAITRGAQRTDLDNLLYARPQQGGLCFLVTNQSPETDHIDALSVLAVDHAPGITVAPDGAGRLHSVGSLIAPVRAVDATGADILPRIAQEDGWHWASRAVRRDTASMTDAREALTLSFSRGSGRTPARLVVDGRNTTWAAMMMGEMVSLHGRATPAWYDSLDHDPALVRQTISAMAQTGFLQVSVWDGNRWLSQGFLPEAGPELAKRQVIPLDLASAGGDTVRIRLETSPGFWLLDRVALDTSAEQALQVRELHPDTATFGDGSDALPLIADRDDRYLDLETSDSARVTFTDPEVPAGMVRSYLLRSTGWYRIHTPQTDAPSPLLAAMGQPGMLARLALARLNQELAGAELGQ